MRLLAVLEKTERDFIASAMLQSSRGWGFAPTDKKRKNNRTTLVVNTIDPSE